jgi:hypothetical protein
VDAGTGSCRALLFTVAGEQVAVSLREWTHHEPPGVPGGQDFDVEANWLAIAACIRDALRLAGATGDQVVAVAATLTRAAMRTNGFAPVVATEFHTIPAPGGGERHIQNRDVLLWLYPGATGVKTGYTAKAGYCVVATAERDGRRLVAVVLGAPGDAFSDAAALMDYGFTAFTQHAFVHRGDPNGVITLPGGSVPVETGGGLAALVPGFTVNGVGAPRVEGILHCTFDDVEAETLLVALVQQGVMAASGSACSSGAVDPSHVLLAMGMPRDRALSSVRFSLGYASTRADIEGALAVVPEVVAKLRVA